MRNKRRKQENPTHKANREWSGGVLAQSGPVSSDMRKHKGRDPDIFMSFAEPLLDAFGDSDESQEPILRFAGFLWNLAIIREADKKMYTEQEKGIMAVLTGDPYVLSPVQALNLLTTMLDRWEQEFYWCRWLIMDMDVEADRRGTHLSFTSVPVGGLLDAMKEREGMEVGAEAGGGAQQSQTAAGVGDED